MAQPTPPPDDPGALLARIASDLEECKRYLGGIYGVLQQQEGLSGMLGELGPMVLQMMGSNGAPAPGPHTHTVIEADRGN